VGKEGEEKCGVVWCGVVWCGVVWCGVVRCGVVEDEEGEEKDEEEEEEEEGEAGTCVYHKNKNPTLRVWGIISIQVFKAYNKFDIYNV